MNHQHPLILCITLVLLVACAAPPVISTTTPQALVQTVVAPASPIPSPTASATQTSNPTPTNQPSPTPTPQRLILWAVGVEAQREQLVHFLEETGRMSGIDLLVVAKTPDALSADLVAGSIAGLDPPDIIWGGADDLFILHRAGMLQSATDQLPTADLLPATISGATADGTRWGTPIAARGFLLLLYNRKIVQAAPNTTDELLSEARRFNGGGRTGLVAGWVEMRWLEAWLQGFGGSSLASDGSPMLDTPELISALDLLKNLRRAGPPPPSTYAEGARLFRDGKAAFAIDGEWSLRMYRAYSETLELGYAPLPIVAASGRPAIGPLEGVYLMYGTQLHGEQLANAQKLAAILSQPQGQERIARELGYLPALSTMLASMAVQNDPALAAAAIGAPHATGIVPSLAQRCVWDAGEALLPALLLGESEPAKVAAKLQERASICLA